VKGSGGNYGPDLTLVTHRLSSEETALRIMNGIRDMPSYRDTLSREELHEILVFLRFLGRERTR
jgi:ubiquinol-cytochrome c reductase cytochrome b subunit